MNTTLRDFLITGKLGSIGLGMSKTDILELLGDGGNSPSGTQRKRGKQDRFTTWQYGRLQLGFLWQTLILIGIYFRGLTHLPERMTIDGYFPNEESTLIEVQEYLSRYQIK